MRRIALCALVVATVASSIAKAEVADGAFVDWARTRAIRLQPLESPEHVIDVDALKRVVGTARVVALGEPAHGAHEPLALRNRLLQLLEQLGFNAIAIESGLSESRRVNDFVMGGAGDAQEVARANLTWGFGNYRENVELLRWIRRYNEDPAHTRKVRFYGIDLSGGDETGQLSGARVALQDALAYLTRAAPDSSRRVLSAAQPFLQRLTHEGYLALSQRERAQLDAAIDGVVAILEHERRTLMAASSADDYEWAHRNAIVARQVAQMFRVWPAGAPGDAPTPNLYKAAESRDASMADNVRWVLQREGSAGRVLLFAHNAHVMNAPIRGGIWSVYPIAPRTMGQHLREALGNGLLIIGTSAAANGADLPVASEAPGRLDIALGRVGLPQFLLDLRPQHARAAAAWLNEPQTMRANFTTELSLSPQSAFDALIFIDRLSAAGR